MIAKQSLNELKAKSPPRQLLKLVIFDCDGVLVDSEPISIDLLLELIQSAGGDMSRQVAYERYLGQSIAKIVGDLEAEHSLSVSGGLLDSMRLGLYERFRRELRPIEAVGEALANLAIPYCVATSSQPERVKLSLAVTGLLPRFGDNIFCASMVTHGKPAPDLFIYAAKRMGVEPQACVVVEDSPAGIIAAKSAGMRVIGFTGGSHAVPARLDTKIRKLSPDLILSDMRDLQGAIATLGAA
jgi:HAD superfamily hydrolase (TIGR01509 family)